MSNTKHTPEKWFLAYDPDLNDTSLAGLVTNPKAHALTTEHETLGNINHKYVPVELAIQAPDLLKERDELKALNSELLEALEKTGYELQEWADHWDREADSFDHPAMEAEKRLSLARKDEILTLKRQIASAINKAKGTL